MSNSFAPVYYLNTFERERKKKNIRKKYIHFNIVS